MNFPKKIDISWLKEKYLAGDLTPQKLKKEISKRAEANQSYNIWITAPQEEKLDYFIDRLPEMDFDKYPLWGIPFAVKDNIDVEAFDTTAACPDFKYTPSESAGVVQRLIDAGAIPIGKSNLDQFATGLVGARTPYGATHNSINPEFVSGGSSGGSAVSVGLGEAVFSLGTDTAGSGRVPGAFNELYGWKPSLGAWPTIGVVPACASLDCVTVFAHSMDTCVTVDKVVRGEHKLDPWSKHFEEIIEKNPKKILLPKEKPEFFGTYKDIYENAWDKMTAFIKKMDIKVEEIDYTLFEDAAKVLYDGPFIAERWSDLGEFVENTQNDIFPVTKEVLSSGKNLDAAELFNSMHKLNAYTKQAKYILEDAVLIMPTTGGIFTRAEVEADPIRTNSLLGKYTNHCNLLDLCACNVPIKGTELPFGITLFALAGNEGYFPELSKKLTREKIDIAVCGLHMRGYPLEYQMIEHEASFTKEAKTAAKYKFIKIDSGITKPGLIKTTSAGSEISVEIWSMPLDKLGSFLSLIPAPLGLGKLELNTGEEVIGFICEGYAEENADDISQLGSWHNLT